MISLKHILLALVLINVFLLVVFFNITFEPATPNASNELLNANKTVEIELTSGFADPIGEILEYRGKKTQKKWDKLTDDLADLQKKWFKMTASLNHIDPFRELGAYPRVLKKYFNSYPDGRPYYKDEMYGLKKNPGYCSLVDFYNLEHPENIFEKMNFFTDYCDDEELPRMDVMRKIGNDTMPFIRKNMSKPIFNSRSYDLEKNINMFFTKRVDIHIYNKIGHHFLCATQMYNHIPGHGVLKRKDTIVNSVDEYMARYANNQKCFNKNMFFPFSYRLYKENECKEFFSIITSEKYIESLKTEPIQWILKVGYGAHRAKGVFLLDADESKLLKEKYGATGEKCGINKKSFIAQTYVTNPLLLDLNNKFDFRIYMLIASTNPLMVYYHDGFLRVSLNSYDKFSTDRTTHLTNTHLSKTIFAKAKDGKINGKTEQELRDYQMWTMEELSDFLYESGKIKDRNWLANTLRPLFKKAFVHTVRMSERSFWKGSNVFEMFGLDFMLDDQLNLWFIECNSSPQLIGTNPYKTQFLVTMLKDMFEIQYNLFRSRMKRVFQLLSRKLTAVDEGFPMEDIEYWKNEYQFAIKNKFEPEYYVRPENTFSLIVDKSIKGPRAYFGHLPDECYDDDTYNAQFEQDQSRLP